MFINPKRTFFAFTLVELLCTLLLSSVIAGSAIAVLSGSIRAYEQILALTEARRRGQMVLQMLRLPVENASLGVPSDEEMFKAAFLIGQATAPGVSTWNGPVSISGSELRLVYAVPTTTVNASTATETFASEDRSVRLSAFPQSGQVQAWSGFGPSTTRSWVVFPPSPFPFLVTRLANQTLSVRSSSPSWIPHNTPLHYLRAMRALSVCLPGQEPAFCTEDVSTGSGLQERVLGIAGFKPVYDPQARTLCLSVLSRGGKRRPEKISPSSLPGWPGPITDEDRHYVLAVTSWTCRIRNGGNP